MADEVRVRFAPSPTGNLHVGGARTALFNWLYARKVGGKFILRVEDTDQGRSTLDSVLGILKGMQWLGLDWDEGPEVPGDYGPYFQSERLDHYRGYADQLMEKQLVYPCFCTPEEIARIKDEQVAAGNDPNYDGRCGCLSQDQVSKMLGSGMDYTIRFRTPDTGETILYDQIRGKVVFRNDLLEDFVIRKSDGMPTYNFAVVVDDALMNITHVIRGDDHISNTPRHILLYQALGFKLPKFFHLPMILGSDKLRLSKRHGAVSVHEFDKMGILPDAMLNYLALLGWSLDGKTEFFTRKQLIKAFSLKRVGSNPAVFDPAKLNWLNASHFMKLSVHDKVEGVYDIMYAEGMDVPDLDEDLAHQMGKIIKLYGKRIKNFPEGAWTLKPFFETYPEYLTAAVTEHLTDEPAARLQVIADRIETMEVFCAEEVEDVVREQAQEEGVEAATIIHALRVALLGCSVSPDVFKLCELMGRELVLIRIRGRQWSSDGHGLKTEI
ncbi:MAG: glutamate--tRNA ligase [bacterium]|nr:glutamate--tRNA ligase [bacterium]